MVRTGATIVIRRITWPHEVQYTSAGKPAAYDDLSVLSFVQGYIITMNSQDSAIREKMM